MSFDQLGNRITQKVIIETDTAGILQFDVTESETHKSTAKVTDHPVETGAQISDHVINEPDTLDLIAWVTNTPIASTDQLIAFSPARAEQAYEQLRQMKSTGAPCAAETTLRTYESMLITELTITRNKDTGQAISVSLKLKELQTATNQTVAAPTPKMLRGNTLKEEGKKPTDAASEAVSAKSRSMLDSLFHELPSNLSSVAH